MRKNKAKPGKAKAETVSTRQSNQTIANDLVDWYIRSHRQLPWRAKPGVCQTPYRTWLSEIMLQQTTVATVQDYYHKFLALWPTLSDLAQASEEDVLREWAGLGYYSRARNLRSCAIIIQRDYHGDFPKTADELQKLPGIGPYTAAAVAALAFGEQVVPVDGNIERVMARLFTLSAPPATIKPLIKKLAQEQLDWAPKIFPGDFAQALMDLGATICTPKSPKCLLCPISSNCQAYDQKTQDKYPVIVKKAEKPRRYGITYLIYNEKGQILTVKRPDRGLFAGMVGLPTTDWVENEELDLKDIWLEKLTALRHIGQIQHSFTHFDLNLRIISARYVGEILETKQWITPEKMPTIGLPKVFIKAYNLTLIEQGKDHDDRL